MSEWTFTKAEAPVRLQDQGIDNNNSSVGRVRRARGISDDDWGVVIGRVIYDASKGLETTTEAAGARRPAQVIYNDDRGVGGGRWVQRLQQQQRRLRQRIDDASKVLKATTEAAADQRHAWWIGNDNGMLIFLAIGLLTVTLSCIFLFDVSFWYCFHRIPLFLVCCKKYYQYWNHAENVFYQVYTNLAYVRTMYRRVKNNEFAWTIKTYVNP